MTVVDDSAFDRFGKGCLVMPLFLLITALIVVVVIVIVVVVIIIDSREM